MWWQVLKLITRAYDPEAGRVLIDGQDVRHVTLPSLRQQLGLVPQDTILFDESVLCASCQHSRVITPSPLHTHFARGVRQVQFEVWQIGRQR